jgi:hypothetical protein
MRSDESVMASQESARRLRAAPRPVSQPAGGLRAAALAVEAAYLAHREHLYPAAVFAAIDDLRAALPPPATGKPSEMCAVHTFVRLADCEVHGP